MANDGFLTQFSQPSTTDKSAAISKLVRFAFADMPPKTATNRTPPRTGTVLPPPRQNRASGMPIPTLQMPPDLPTLSPKEPEEAKKRAWIKEAPPLKAPPTNAPLEILSPDPKQSRGSSSPDEDVESIRRDNGTTSEVETLSTTPTPDVMPTTRTDRPYRVPQQVWHARNAERLSAHMRNALDDENHIAVPDTTRLTLVTRPDLPPLRSPEPTRPHPVRCDIQFLVAGGDQMDDNLRLGLIQFLSRVLKHDPQAVIYPWRQSDCTGGLKVVHHPSELPTKFSELSCYVYKSKLESEAGMRWGNIFLVSPSCSPTLSRNVNHGMLRPKRGSTRCIYKTPKIPSAWAGY